MVTGAQGGTRGAQEACRGQRRAYTNKHTDAFARYINKLRKTSRSGKASSNKESSKVLQHREVGGGSRKGSNALVKHFLGH